MQEMNKSGVWKSLESKPAEAMEGERSPSRLPGSKDNTPDEGIVIKVRQGQLVQLMRKLYFSFRDWLVLIKTNKYVERCC